MRTLLERMDELDVLILESWQSTVTLELDDFEDEVEGYMYDSFFRAKERRPEEYDAKDWRKDKGYSDWHKMVVGPTRKSMAKIASGVARIIKGLDLDGIRATVKPWPRSTMYSSGGDYGTPTDMATVYIHRGGKRGRTSPSFTYFGPREIDDVLDAGDGDFFNDPEVEHAYFQVVSELRSPGSTRKRKPVKVYTSRPKKDRKIYDNAKEVPSGIFVTNDPDRAYGFGRDLGSKDGRDLYRIVVDSNRLVQTLKSGRIRDYQIVGKGKVPIREIERIA